VISAAIAALLPACGSSDDPTPSGTAGAASVAGSSGSGAGAATTAGASNAGTGDATKGKAVYTGAGACQTCHGDDGKGSQGPNITPSMTAGIGSWTYQQFHDAIRTGKAPNGTQLCTLMTVFAEKDISESSMQDLWAYVKSFPVSDVVQKGSYVTMGFCPAR